jgi:hypothetical protein
MCKAGERETIARIPPRGSGPTPQGDPGSFNARQRRELARGDTCDRVRTRLGDRCKSAAVNSSTVKGPRGLAGQCHRRRAEPGTTDGGG